MCLSSEVLAQDVASDRSGTGARSASDDIVVTARRREENLQDVPLSIVAFSQESLRENAVVQATDLGKVTPGLVAVAGSGNPTIVDFSIRGRGLNFGAAAGSVETYFAEVPLSPPFQQPQLPPQFFDIASVQVLKGPQGTLFGRSTTGGAVLIQPQLPTDRLEGYRLATIIMCKSKARSTFRLCKTCWRCALPVSTGNGTAMSNPQAHCPMA